ncbi:MAG TPA: hypothetical protein VJN92_01835 [Candidatus Acidoferrum sp.]|nr:hypothetical protein [Candidatus Acidoferrum sp.]
MGKRTIEEMLLLDHQDRALSSKLTQMFIPLLQAALGKQLWEITTNRQEMSPYLRELLEALREVELARHALWEKEAKAQEALMRLMRGKNIEVPLCDHPKEKHPPLR